MMNHLLTHFPTILANEQRGLTKKRRGEQKKNYSRCHARLYEKADPLKAQGLVASFLRNRKFYLINNKLMGLFGVFQQPGSFFETAAQMILPAGKELP